jgi:PIN domain nuclease of toxin-antitoxin system
LKAILDTHAFIWWVTNDSRITDNVRQIIADSSNELFLSVASCWEMIIKMQLGKLTLTGNPESFIPEQMLLNSIRGLPIQVSHTLHVYKLPLHHRDPFDRLIISQSQIEKMPVITSDPLFKEYDLKIIWK